MTTVRPQAIIFLVTLGVVILIAVIRRVTRRQPVDERRVHLFPYATPGQYTYAAVLTALWAVAAGVGRVVLSGGRVVAKAWHRDSKGTV
jgi:hypothetical protein